MSSHRIACLVTEFNGSLVLYWVSRKGCPVELAMEPGQAEPIAEDLGLTLHCADGCDVPHAWPDGTVH